MFKISVSELRNQKIVEREWKVDPLVLLGEPPELTAYAHPVCSTVKAEWMEESILVSGTVATIFTFTCGRCLKIFDQSASAEFKQSLPIEGDVIDVADLLKEALVTELPIRALCAPTCQGLCPVCGVNKNLQKCECQPLKDQRWAPLKNFPFNKS